MTKNVNSSITYNRARKDITFCTMMFRLPTDGALDALKHMERKFEEFYLPALERYIQVFGQVCLWCDAQTAEYLTKHGLADKINMRVMDFTELPHYHMRDEYLRILHSNKNERGYLLHAKTPEQWIDYMILIHAKPSVVKWAADNNKFKSKYFMWIDGGALNSMYSGFWANWTGRIDARPDRCRFTIAPTMGKTRPHFVPKFLFELYNYLFVPRIQDATNESLARQKMKSIAMINADYDVPAGAFMIPQEWADRFYEKFETTRRIMLRHNLVSTEQAIFQTMMKFDVDHMFEVSYIRGYTGLYAAIAQEKPDYKL